MLGLCVGIFQRPVRFFNVLGWIGRSTTRDPVLRCRFDPIAQRHTFAPRLASKEFLFGFWKKQVDYCHLWNLTDISNAFDNQSFELAKEQNANLALTNANPKPN